MDRTLTHFIAALRNAEVRISPAETLDAMNAVELVGYRDRAFLKDSLALVLPKTADEKETFDTTFDQFFSFEDVAGQTVAVEGDGAVGDGDSDGEDGEGGGEGEGQGEGLGGGKGSGGKGKKSKYAAAEEEEEEDLGPGAMAEPRSALARLLIKEGTTELTVRMAEAAKEANLTEIQVFTQKGLYTRKIMDAMGLADLVAEIGELRSSPQVPERRLAQELKRRRDWLRELVRDYVERQFLLHADATGRRLREDLLQRVKLSNVEHRNFRLIQEIVLRMAKKLAALHSRRRKCSSAANCTSLGRCGTT